MRLLSYANWKQKLPFDNIIYKEVKRYSLRLNSYERAIMDEEINFYREHFSLLQVMKHFKLLKTTEDKETFIKAVLKRQDRILYIPDCLIPYFKNKIKTEYGEYKAFFEIMLDKATNASFKNPLIYMLKTIFGDFYKPVVKKIKKYSKQQAYPIKHKKLPVAGYENMARAYIHELQNDLVLTSIYGRSSIRRNVPISIVDDYGYGEWISKNVSYATNRLFVYSNNNKLTDEQLKHMIYFNVYPGFGYFYNTVLDDPENIAFDNGATFLINGWAMYAMYSSSKNYNYHHSIKVEASKIINNLLKNNLKKGYENTYIYLLTKYTKTKAIEYMLDYTQYPAHYMSYVMGGFATEEIIDTGFAFNPVDYLKTLRTINCGDFFALFSPKMQKKIAETNIVAKVSQKFNKPR